MIATRRDALSTPPSRDRLADRYEWQWDLIDPSGWTTRQNIIVLDMITGVCYTGMVRGGRGYIEAEIDEMIESGELP